ncbi:MAG: helix-turn-helix domain-containing protein [Clostridia bacterium]|nr:helix-turn-helix domain-containing protein [Clostridia bacterium]
MLNKKIKELRTSFGISQTELANQIGVSKQCVSNWENDNVLPSVEMLITLAKFFKVSTDYLLGLDKNDYINVTGLTETQKAHILLIIKDLLEK